MLKCLRGSGSRQPVWYSRIAAEDVRITKFEKESCDKIRIEKEKKDYDEMLKRGDEVRRLSERLVRSFDVKGSLSDDDRDLLDSLEKNVKKIREELGGDGDDEKIDKVLGPEVVPTSQTRLTSSSPQSSILSKSSKNNKIQHLGRRDRKLEYDTNGRPFSTRQKLALFYFMRFLCGFTVLLLAASIGIFAQKRRRFTDHRRLVDRRYERLRHRRVGPRRQRSGPKTVSRF